MSTTAFSLALALIAALSGIPAVFDGVCDGDVTVKTYPSGITITTLSCQESYQCFDAPPAYCTMAGGGTLAWCECDGIGTLGKCTTVLNIGLEKPACLNNNCTVRCDPVPGAVTHDPETGALIIKYKCGCPSP